MRLARYDECDLGALGLDEDTLDGPFLLRDGSFGMLVSLRGKDGGALPTQRELHWRRDVAPRVRTEDVHLFLRQGARLTYLGTARVTRKGQPARDGFRFVFGLAEPIDDARFRAIVDELTRAPPPAPEEAIAALGPGSTTAARVAAMRTFASRWWGCSPDAPATTLGDGVPSPLADLHGALEGHAVCVQNRLVRPERQEDGTIIFYVENQGVCVWATAPGGDPPVLVRSNEHGAPWQKEADSLSGFLIQLLVLEAVLGAPFRASHNGLGARELARLTRRLLPLPLPPWAASRTRFYGSSGVVGFASPSGDEFDVWLGAKDRVRLEPLDDLVANWDDVGF